MKKMKRLGYSVIFNYSAIVIIILLAAQVIMSLHVQLMYCAFKLCVLV
jgi:hypothetical protein